MFERNELSASCRFARAVRPLALAGVVALGLSACTDDPARYLSDDITGSIDVRDRYPIAVDRQPAELHIAASRRSHRLTHEQKQEIRGFLAAFKANGSGKVVVRRPVGGSNQYAAKGVVKSIKHMIDRNGVPRERVVLTSYRARGASPVVMTFARYTASSPECGDWSRNAANTYNNKPHPNFGCAYQANIAAMVADPRDLKLPRTMDPPDAQHRDHVFEDYRKGTATASEKSEDQKSNVSEVSQ